MSVLHPLTMSELLARYIELRRIGQSMDDTVSQLRNEVFQLPRDERKQLGQIVNEWEGKYGASPRSAPPMQKPEPTNQVTNSVFKPSGPAPFGTSFLDPSKLPAALRGPQQSIICPRCGKVNPAGTSICKFCNHIFPLAPVVTRKFENSDQLNGQPDIASPTYFGPTSTLLLLVEGQKKPFEAYPHRQLIIGRATSMQLRPVNIDLAPYNAEALGVSRVHAELRCQDNTLLLIDLKSQNGTYVNGLRLYGPETRVLRSGDMIRFGRLTVKATFKHQ